jgi:DUF917 family protein
VVVITTPECIMLVMEESGMVLTETLAPGMLVVAVTVPGTVVVEAP